MKLIFKLKNLDLFKRQKNHKNFMTKNIKLF